MKIRLSFDSVVTVFWSSSTIQQNFHMLPHDIEYSKNKRVSNADSMWFLLRLLDVFEA